MLLNTIEHKRDAEVSLFGSIMGLFGGIGGGAPRQLPSPGNNIVTRAVATDNSSSCRL